jgi:alpha-1,3-glucosyltransferase
MPVEVASTSMDFLPLLLTSVYCAIGLVWAFIRLGAVYITDMVPTA